MKTQTYILVLGLALLSFIQEGSRRHKTGWDNEQLKGRVKSCRVFYYQATTISGNVSKASDTPFEESYGIFDIRGNEIESGDHNYSTHKSSRIVNTYNNNGYCIKTMAYEYNGSDTTIQITLAKYDDKGNKVESQLSLLSGNDPEGGNTSMKAIYKYDTRGNLMQWNYIKGSDTALPQNVYTYNNRGDIIEDDFYNARQNLQTRTLNNYNVKGVKTKTTSNWYNDGPAVVRKLICLYDEHGNAIEGDEYDATGNLLAKGTFKIYYDGTGNRIKQIEYTNNKPVSVAEYKIVYY